jgi:superoxide dismutase, Cu-Zn family
MVGPMSFWKRLGLLALPGLLLAPTGPADAKNPGVNPGLEVTIHHISENGVGQPAGTITIRPSRQGLELVADLKGLPAGEHGFHLHEKPSCEPGEKAGVKTAGHAAGNHFDPEATGAHKGPGGGGHKGDLPRLRVSKQQTFRGTLKVVGLTLRDVAGRSLMIHAGGDNYSDSPEPLGGGAGRIACGVIPAAPASKVLNK